MNIEDITHGIMKNTRDLRAMKAAKATLESGGHVNNLTLDGCAQTIQSLEACIKQLQALHAQKTAVPSGPKKYEMYDYRTGDFLRTMTAMESIKYDRIADYDTTGTGACLGRDISSSYTGDMIIYGVEV